MSDEIQWYKGLGIRPAPYALADMDGSALTL